MKRILLFFFFCLCLFVFVSCADETKSTTKSAEYSVTLHTDENIVVMGDTSITVKEGKTAVFQLGVKDGYKIDSYSCGIYNEKAGTLTIPDVTENINVFVISAELKYTVTLHTDENIIVAGNSVLKVAQGDSAMFQLVLKKNYKVASCSGGVYDEVKNTLTIENVTEDKEIFIISVFVAPNEYIVTLQTDQNIIVEGSALQSVFEGDNAVFHITPKEGFIIDSYSCGVYDATAGTLTISNVTSSTTVMASTAKIHHMVHLQENMNVTVTGALSQSIAWGENAVFHIAPKAGYKIISCSNGVYDEINGTLTISNVKAPMTVTIETIKIHTVTLQVDEHTIVKSDTIKYVATSETAMFEISFAQGYKFASASVGAYDATTSILTVANVTENITVFVTSMDERSVTVELTGSILYYEVTDAQGNELSDRAQTVLKGEDVVFYIKGISNRGIESVAGGTYDAATGKLTFSNVTENISCRVNVKKHTIVYHANNGTTNTVVQEPSFAYYTAPNTKWDDGSFTNAGKVLIEYNTKADGTGESFSLGSKVHLFSPYKAQLDLYCIWAEETSTSDFTFSSSTVKVNGTTGYAITKYKGNADTVVLPTKYNNRPVVQINAGAFENKTMKTLVTNKNLLKVQSGSFVGCSSLNTMYFANSIWEIPDDAFDAATYSNFHNFYLNATKAPSITKYFDGFYRVKWDRLMATEGQKRIIFVSGSSSLWGISSEYLEKLLDEEYAVVNYGTIRTTSSMLYFEAISNVVDDDDTIILAPECSSLYQMGGTSLGGGNTKHKVFRDVEGAYNIFRYVDIANYTNYFSGLTEYNKNYTEANDYEWYPDASATSTSYPVYKLTYPGANSTINKYGDLINNNTKNQTRSTYSGKATSFDGKTYNYADDANTANIAEYAANFNKIAAIAEGKGAKVFFGFCPVNEKSLTIDADPAAYDALVAQLYDFDILGSSADHVFANNLFYYADQHHLTNYGTVKHTYQFYLDICEAFDIEVNYDINAFKGTIDGCAW